MNNLSPKYKCNEKSCGKQKFTLFTYMNIVFATNELFHKNLAKYQ